ncbi:MAG: SAM-dependent chlorinase/fluorinase [candidate division KSB1 bacterium]|nr:SAM-dependent chlorinase/fluorinase [candidate division KSB1 bacterium]MDZ7345731.1 SAM-dependent chlorinase/fluorinase [candidate division KSB1 bacterium]
MESSKSKSRIITLTTDFGLRDAFVGVMKGVILRINPAARIVDITHGIAQGDIDAAAFALDQAHAFFPEETIHVVVVDPTVGTDRRILLVRAGGWFFLAPDNTVLKYIFARYGDAQVLAVTNSYYFLPHTSRTFHGRDIMAPVAAHLSLGTAFLDFGTRIDDPLRGEVLLPLRKGKTIHGKIVYIDHFGNCISNISKKDLVGETVKEINVKEFQFDRLSRSYAENPVGEPLAIVSSHDHLEIAVRDGNAAAILKLEKGDPIEVVLE